MNTKSVEGGATQYKKVSAREKYCFGIGAIGKDAICNMVGVFLMVYFTVLHDGYTRFLWILLSRRQ